MSTMEDRLIYWINERNDIRKQNEAGNPLPWTEDAILKEYRFCNVRREDDRVTKWMRKNWAYKKSHLVNSTWWFTVARMINWPPTLKLLYPFAVDGEVEMMVNIIENAQSKRPKQKVFGSAYIVSTNGHKIGKAEYFGKMWSGELMWPGPNLHPWSLHHSHKNLMQLNGLGSFLAAQIIADLKYDGPLFDAEDFYTWAAPGPGSMRGLNRLLGLPLKKKWNQTDFLNTMNPIRRELTPRFPYAIEAQDFQNCLCEFDKYCRVLLGEGRPRANYESHHMEYSV